MKYYYFYDSIGIPTDDSSIFFYNILHPHPILFSIIGFFSFTGMPRICKRLKRSSISRTVATRGVSPCSSWSSLWSPTSQKETTGSLASVKATAGSTAERKPGYSSTVQSLFLSPAMLSYSYYLHTIYGSKRKSMKLINSTTWSTGRLPMFYCDCQQHNWDHRISNSWDIRFGIK